MLTYDQIAAMSWPQLERELGLRFERRTIASTGTVIDVAELTTPAQKRIVRDWMTEHGDD